MPASTARRQIVLEQLWTDSFANSIPTTPFDQYCTVLLDFIYHWIGFSASCFDVEEFLHHVHRLVQFPQCTVSTRLLQESLSANYERLSLDDYQDSIYRQALQIKLGILLGRSSRFNSDAFFDFFLTFTQSAGQFRQNKKMMHMNSSSTSYLHCIQWENTSKDPISLHITGHSSATLTADPSFSQGHSTLGVPPPRQTKQIPPSAQSLPAPKQRKYIFDGSGTHSKLHHKLKQLKLGTLPRKSPLMKPG